MKIVREGEPRIMRLWGKPAAKPADYRLMKYLLRETADGKEYICNNVTGELVQLSEEESRLIQADVFPYSDTLKELAEHHFLVHKEYDEYGAVLGMRKVLRALEPKPKYITHYTILPTTACNARCYYCIEQGSKIVTMSEETADRVVEFIKEQCGNNRVDIKWYGGEPTVAKDRITQICKGLAARGIEFSSTMISNGYLFDEELVEIASDIWKITHIRFSFDGSKENYNKIKNYINPCENPYEKVLSSVGLFLERKIDVDVRMNFDVDNSDDFQILISDLVNLYGKDEHLTVYASPVYGEYPNRDGCLCHGSDKWMAEQEALLNDFSVEQGLFRWSRQIPSMRVWGCGAENPSCLVVTPEGGLTRCMSVFEEEDFVGTINEGITDRAKYHSWEITDFPELCADCEFVPLCIKYPNCPGFDDCFQRYRNHRIVHNIKDNI